MKIKKSSLVTLSVLAFMCLMPFLFAAGGDVAEAGDETSSYVKFITTIFGQEPGDPARFFTFLGRFHPLVLHLPIGMVVLAVHLMAFALWKKRDDLDFAYVFTLGFGFITACVAVLFGSFLAMTNDYNTELVDRHGWGGLVFAMLVGVSFVLMVKYLKSDKSKDTLKKVSFGILAVNLGVMSFVGHDGGSLTHGRTYLFEYGPDWVRAIEGLPPYREPGALDPEGTVYEQLVAPFLKNHCYKCHNEDKVKGKLRLDTIDFIKQGGKTDDPPLIVHGNAEGSNLYQLMVIDDEDEIMPPDGMLPQSHTDFIKWWIDTAETDADLFEKKVKDANVPEKFKTINSKKKLKVKEAHKGANEEAKAAPTDKVEEKVEEVKEQAEAVKEKAVEAVASTGGVDFAKQVAPIFEERCIKCHGEEKQKGEYRMDKAEFVMVAGESEEKPIVPGKPDESYLVKLIKMTDDDDDVMPPKGGTLKPEQIAIIVKWIEEGAKFPTDLQLQDKSPKKK